MKYKISFKADWTEDGENLILPKDLNPILEGKIVSVEFFNKESKE